MFDFFLNAKRYEADQFVNVRAEDLLKMIVKHIRRINKR